MRLKLPVRALLVGSIFTAIFSYVSLVGANRINVCLPATQLSSISIMFCVLIVLLINPLMRLCKLKGFSRKEILLIFIMATVPAGLAVFGYVCEAIPLAGTLYNPKYNTPQSGWDKTVVPYVDKTFFVQDEKALEDYNKGLRAYDKEAFPIIVPKDTVGTDSGYFQRIWKYITDSEYRAKNPFWGDIPWGAWLKPLIMWGILGLAFCVLFYAINELVFRQWYENEKLVFPIADLSMTILGTEKDSDKSGIPSVYKVPLFWVGFAISFIILFYNGAVNAHWMESLSPVNLNGSMDKSFRDTILEGVTPRFKLMTIFTVLGLGFLLPKDISFSAWFFFILMKIQQLLAVWLGFGKNGQSFPKNWLSDCNFMTSQGGGAMFVFGSVCLWKVRHQMLAFFYKLAVPNGTSKMSSEEIKQYSLPSFLFFLTTIIIIYFMMRGKVSFCMSVLAYFTILMIVVAFVRIVAECGLIGFQAWFGPIHVVKSFGLLKFSSIFASGGIATVIIIVASMFADTKTFIPPTMMNARYIAERGKISKWTFAISIFSGIVIALLVGNIVALVLAYDQGGGYMNTWFFVNFPQSTIQKVANSMTDYHSLQTMDFNAFWIIFGAITCGLLIFFRQMFFWVPHPLGLVMYTNPLMHGYWFCLLIAWICKSAAIKYCNADGYQVVKAGFIGLIMGEITVVALSLILSLLGYDNMGIVLNRY